MSIAANNTTTTTPGTTLPKTDNRMSPVLIGTLSGYAVVAFVIIVGNLLCLVAFLKTKRMRKRPYYLLVSLSVADFLVGVSILETVSLEVTTVVRSKVVPSTLYYLAGPASLYVLTAISIERFIVTVFPLYHHRSTGVKLYIGLIAAPWLVSCVVLTVFILAFKVNILPRTALNFARILVPVGLAIIIFAYSAIVLALKCSAPPMQANGSNHQVLRDRKLAVTLFIVTILSLVTWMPYSVYITVLSYCKCSTSSSQQVVVALNWLKYLNSGINVFVYILRMPEFKRALLGKCFQNSVGVDLSSRVGNTRSEIMDISLSHNAVARPVK